MSDGCSNENSGQGRYAEGGNATVDLKKSRRRQLSAADPLKLDRVPPNSVEGEQGVVGCVLLSPRQCISECQEKGLTPESFYDMRHSTLMAVLYEMHGENENIDLITLQQKLKNKQQLEGVGGLAYIASLSDTVPSAANLMYYVAIVKEKYILRKMIQVCTQAVSQAYEHEGDVYELLDHVEGEIMAINREREQTTVKPIKDLVQTALSRMEAMHSNQGQLTGISTGFADLDKKTTGLQGGDVWTFAARPGQGKSALGMNIADYVACEGKIPVGVFTLEMTADSLVMRTICSRSRVNQRQLQEGFLAERDFPKLAAAASKIATSQLFIDDTGGLSILQLKARARRMVQQYGCKLFVIDYLQLMHSTNKKAQNRQQEIADISWGVKALAKELHVPIIILSQLNRDLEKRGAGARPRLSDIRESGASEQDSDLVGLLFDEEEEEDFERDIVPMTLFIAKQRNGSVGDVRLTFLKTITRFESAAKINTADVPARQRDFKQQHND